MRKPHGIGVFASDKNYPSSYAWGLFQGMTVASGRARSLCKRPMPVRDPNGEDQNWDWASNYTFYWDK